MDTPGPDELRSRLPSVHAVLYLLFNVGYLSAHAEQAIRRELCEEAIRLATLLAENPVGAVPETFAIAECEGPAAGLAVLDGLVRPPWLEESYLWDAVFADVHRRAGNLDLARRHGEKALEGAPSAPVRELLRRRLGL